MLTDPELLALAEVVLTKPLGGYTKAEKDRIATLLHMLANDIERDGLWSQETTHITLGERAIGVWA